MCVLRCLLKVDSEEACLMFKGRLFHSFRAATEKAPSPLCLAACPRVNCGELKKDLKSEGKFISKRTINTQKKHKHTLTTQNYHWLTTGMLFKARLYRLTKFGKATGGR